MRKKKQSKTSRKKKKGHIAPQINGKQFFPDRTDTGLAEAFLKKTGIKLRFDANRKALLIYKKGLWEITSDKHVTKLIIAAAQEWSRVVSKSYPDEMFVIAHLRNRKGAKAVLEMLKAKAVISSDKFDRHKDLVNTRNGVLHIPTLRLLKHSYRFYFTMRVNAAFTPKAKPPKLLMQLLFNLVALPLATSGGNFLENARRIQFLCRLCAISISGKVTEHILPILCGMGSNGKSTLIELLTFIFGSYASKLFIATLSRRKPAASDMARTKGKRFLSAAETSEDFKLNTATLKSFTGGDTISARHLYQSWFDFLPESTLWLHTNILPDISDRTHGIWRRIKVIRSHRIVTEDKRDPRLLEKLQAHADEIFSYLVSYYPKYMNGGLNVPKSIQQETETYKSDTNPLSPIWHLLEIDPEAQVIGLNSSYFMFVKTIRKLQNDWAHQNHEKKLSSKAIVKILSDSGFGKDRRSENGQTDWAIIGIRPAQKTAGASTPKVAA